MVADCHNEAGILGVSMTVTLRAKAKSLPTEKPERKMPKSGDNILTLYFDFNGVRLDKDTWHSTVGDRKRWEAGWVFLLSESDIAQAKVERLNEVLRS